VNPVHCASPATPISLIETIAQNHPDSRELICQKFAKGLTFFLRHLHPNDFKPAFQMVINKTIAEVRGQRVTNEEDLCRFVQKAARDTAATFPRVGAVAVDPGAVSAIRERLAVFTPLQHEALRRFYMGEQSATTLCQELGIHVDHFDYLRTVARHLLQLAFATRNNTQQPATLSGDSFYSDGVGAP